MAPGCDWALPLPGLSLALSLSTLSSSCALTTISSSKLTSPPGSGRVLLECPSSRTLPTTRPCSEGKSAASNTDGLEGAASLGCLKEAVVGK